MCFPKVSQYQFVKAHIPKSCLSHRLEEHLPQSHIPFLMSKHHHFQHKFVQHFYSRQQKAFLLCHLKCQCAVLQHPLLLQRFFDLIFPKHHFLKGFQQKFVCLLCFVASISSLESQTRHQFPN